MKTASFVIDEHLYSSFIQMCSDTNFDKNEKLIQIIVNELNRYEVSRQWKIDIQHQSNNDREYRDNQKDEWVIIGTQHLIM